MSNSDELKQMRRERDFLRELLDLGSQDDLSPLLEKALDLIVQMTHAKKGYLELHPDSDGHDDLQPQDKAWSVARACTEEELAEIRKRISRGIISKAMAEGQTIETPSAISDERFRDRKSVRAHKIEAVLCAPVGNPPIGVVYLQGRELPGRFADDDKEWAEIFARQLTPLADRLLSQKRQQIATDPTRDIRKNFSCPGILGRSESLAQVLRTASYLAPLVIDVLLTGPSGTGKTAMARAIHRNSPRSEGPFVELNCAAIPESLFESELFGAEAGAHSSAMSRKAGKVEAAENGTLFLDEIGELSLGSQAKLLQLLQSREYYPLGSNKPKHANVRIISATNVDLMALVSERRFREDLYYRLNVVPLEMPPLSARMDDIPILVEYLCQQTCQRLGLEPLPVSRDALVACREATWPGNIRELDNAVQKAVIHANGQKSGRLETRHLFPDQHSDADASDGPRTLQQAMRGFQRRFVRDALEGNEWNVAETARQLGIVRSHLYNLIKTHELTRKS